MDCASRQTFYGNDDLASPKALFDNLVEMAAVKPVRPWSPASDASFHPSSAVGCRLRTAQQPNACACAWLFLMAAWNTRECDRDREMMGGGLVVEGGWEQGRQLPHAVVSGRDSARDRQPRVLSRLCHGRPIVSAAPPVHIECHSRQHSQIRCHARQHSGSPIRSPTGTGRLR